MIPAGFIRDLVEAHQDLAVAQQLELGPAVRSLDAAALDLAELSFVETGEFCFKIPLRLQAVLRQRFVREALKQKQTMLAIPRLLARELLLRQISIRSGQIVV